MTDEKNPQEAKVRSGLSAKRNPVSYQTTQDIVIPAGTLLRCSGEDEFSCSIGFVGEFSIKLPPGYAAPSQYKKVIAA